MIRFLLLIAIVLGALYLIRWFLTTPAEDVASKVRKSLWLLLGLGLIFLALSGRLNIIFAFIGSAIPFIAKQLPVLLRLLGLAKTIRHTKQENKSPESPRVTKMNLKEALAVLGLAENPSKQQIIDAHKRLMQKLHPDKGGSAHLASQLNEAKTVLLKNYEQ
jgi:DnaJ homolog subfamily C member 19